MSDQNAIPLHQRAWEIIKETVVFSHKPWVHVVRKHVKLANGIEIDDFYHVDMPIFSAVFPITADGGVILVEQYRAGAGQAVLEVPAGNIEENATSDSALLAAQRELQEETGYTADDWYFLGKYYIDSNRKAGEAWIYLARNVELTEQTTLDATEIIAHHKLPIAEVRQLWKDGKIGGIVSNAVIGLALEKLRDLEGK